MAPFKEGCVVRHRPTQSLYTVVRWDQDAALFLLTPVVHPSAASQSTSAKERPRTRWAFEKMVDVAETSKAPTDGVATQSDGASAGAGAGAGTAAPTKNSAKPSTLDPTSYARRAAKLDRRVEFQLRPKSGRGLFAHRDVPAGTEVMRVPAAGAVMSGRGAKGSCAGCFLSTKAVGTLDACPGCSFRLCARCKTQDLNAPRSGGGAGHSGTCELTKEFLRLCSTNPGGNGSSDEGLLRLVADLFVRRKAGVISDEEWNLVMSLESHDNEARAMGLSTSVLQICARLLKSLVGIDPSQEDLQAMYRRVTRNVHTVSPNITPFALGSVSSTGSVEGLFPCGALVNHSCTPNSHFHCVAKASASAEGRPVIEQVLRTVRDVRAGEELCYSYLADSAAGSVVSERRAMLEGWGFRCGCKRCQRDAEEKIRLTMRPTPMDRIALAMLGRLEDIIKQGQRNAADLQEEEIAPTIEPIVEFLAREERRLSPGLASRIAIDLSIVTTLVGISDPAWRVMVLGFAANAHSEIGSAAEISVRLEQYKSSRLAGCGQPYKAVGMSALRQAVLLHGVFYGEEHEQSINLREKAKEIIRRSM